MTEQEETQLVRRALGGDDLALRALVAVLTPIVQYRVASVLMRMRPGHRVDYRSEVQDLTQEVFLRLFQNGGRIIHSWDPARGARLSHFVGVVAQRQAVSALRGQGKAAAKFSDSLDELEGELPSGGMAPDREAISRQELAQLLDLLRARLSPFGLELFYRIFVHEEAVEDICAATGMTPNAVYIWRTRLTKLTNNLREELGTTPNPQVTRETHGADGADSRAAKVFHSGDPQ